MDVEPRSRWDERDHGHCDHPADDAVTDDGDSSYRLHSHYLCRGVAYGALRYENDSRLACGLDDRNEDSRLSPDAVMDTCSMFVDDPIAAAAVVVAAVADAVAAAVVEQHTTMGSGVFDQVVYVTQNQLTIVSCRRHSHNSSRQELHCCPFLLSGHYAQQLDLVVFDS